MEKLKSKKMLMGVGTLALLSLLPSCKDDDPQTEPGMVLGPEVAVGNGKARSFVKLDGSGTVTTIGFTMTKSALDNLPHEEESYVLALPAEKSKTPYEHISLDWASHGHSPDGIYNKPHFDMHFYMITEGERNSIQPGPDMEKLPEAKFMPPTYISIPGEGVPQMGKHWGDITSPEFQGKPFTVTFVYGSYNGKVIFHEPMIAHEWLLTQPDTLMNVPQPTAFEHSARYPTQYSVKFDKKTEVYTVSLDNLTQK